MNNTKTKTTRFKTKTHVKKNDMVYVRSGDDKGKKGRVLEVMVDKMKALVEGVNIVSRHTKPNAKNTQGGIVKKEAPVHISKLMLLDPKDGKPTRVGRKRENEKSVRFAKGRVRSGQVIK
ncbi:MAG: 50S ribosomal protein L24 [Chitinophagales bacterium]|nr:50S ribosomal protein L24 [Chitinophagales bacterium]